MNQYERTNAVHFVEGYDLRVSMGKTRAQEFEAAKAECIRHLRAQLGNIESLTFDQYIAERRERTERTGVGGIQAGDGALGGKGAERAAE